MTPGTLSLRLALPDGTLVDAAPTLQRALLAGYTGRNRAAVLEHIRELEQLGVAPPPQVPMIYEVPADLLTQAQQIDVASEQTSGEVEFYLAPSEHGLLVGVASDHTDRKEEAVDVARSKGLCPKVLSSTVWRVEDVQDHWDDIEIHSWVTLRGERRLYQEGRLSAFLPVDDLLATLRAAGYQDLGQSLVLGGTLPVQGGFACGERFEGELRDPVLRRALTIDYRVVTRRGA